MLLLLLLLLMFLVGPILLFLIYRSLQLQSLLGLRRLPGLLRLLRLLLLLLLSCQLELWRRRLTGGSVCVGSGVFSHHVSPNMLQAALSVGLGGRGPNDFSVCLSDWHPLFLVSVLGVLLLTLMY